MAAENSSRQQGFPTDAGDLVVFDLLAGFVASEVMMWQLIALILVSSIGSLGGGLLLVLFKKNFTHQQNLLIISFAAGVMLATVFFDIFPETDPIVWWAVLLGIMTLFILEKFLIWHHHHDDGCNNTPLLLNIGDTIHNFIDGVVIGATFLTNPSLGLITTLAVSLHEIPHEMADFAVMLSAGWSKTKTIIVNVLSALISLVGALGVYALGNRIHQWIPFLMSFAGGMFIYLACSDLIPELHHAHENGKLKNNLVHILSMSFGIILIYSLISLLEG